MGMQQGTVLSHFLFALLVVVVTEFAREGALNELLYYSSYLAYCSKDSTFFV